MSLPRVMDEWHTLRRVRDNRMSLARYGDGEIKLMMGHYIKSQPYSRHLAQRLRHVAQNPSDRVMVGIPRIYDEDVIPAHKIGFWERYASKRRARFFLGNHIYGSSFVTRPDHFVELDCEPFWDLWRSLWEDRTVLYLRGAQPDRTPPHWGFMDNAFAIATVRVPPSDAWVDRKAIVSIVRRAAAANGPNFMVLMSIGATATVLCHQLGELGIQCIDLGHSPQYYRDRNKVVTGEKPEGMGS